MLTDFGLSERVVEAVSTRAAGTPHHMAPEVVQKGRKWDRMSDIWSVGTAAIEMYDGRPPLGNLDGQELLDRIVKDPSPKPIRQASAHFAQFLSACLKKEPADRESAALLMAQPFVAAKYTTPGSKERTETLAELLRLSRAAGEQRTTRRRSTLRRSRQSKSGILRAGSTNSATSVGALSDDGDAAELRKELAELRAQVKQQQTEIEQLKGKLKEGARATLRERLEIMALHGSAAIDQFVGESTFNSGKSDDAKLLESYKPKDFAAYLNKQASEIGK